MRLIKIGRSTDCDIVLSSEMVSAIHAELVLKDNGDITLEDKSSSNGTYVMNRRIAPGRAVSVKRGDTIRFADTELRWMQVPLPEDNSAYKAVFGIGSHFSNDIRIEGSTVSRYHATLKLSKDGKMYIFDHSKNGTTVDGVRIPSNVAYRIQKDSAVVCGGIPTSLSKVIPNTDYKGIALKCVGAAVLLAIIVAGIVALKGERKYTDQELYNRYNSSVVMIRGYYHYRVEIGEWTEQDYRLYNSIVSQLLGDDKRIPMKVSPVGDDITSFTNGQLTEHLNSMASDREQDQAFYGTAFFISEDGRLVTNLHLVKPWLFDTAYTNMKHMEELFTQRFAENYEMLKNMDEYGSEFMELVSKMASNLSRVKMIGELDYIALCPQNEVFDIGNMHKCRVLLAGDNIEKDVALIQTNTRILPPNCRFIDLTEELDTDETALGVGEHVYTLGFPNGRGMQREEDEKGILIIAQDGKITQESTKYTFGFNAASMCGASGSPIFNEYGKVIGVLNSGYDIQGYNYAIKAVYVQELLDNSIKIY